MTAGIENLALENLRAIRATAQAHGERLTLIDLQRWAAVRPVNPESKHDDRRD